MHRSLCLQPHPDRLVEQLDGLRVVAVSLLDVGQPLVDVGHGGMLTAERPLADGERLPEQVARCGGLPALQRHVGELLDRLGGRQIERAEHLDVDREHLPEVGASLVKPSLALHDAGQIEEVNGGFRMLSPEGFFVDFNRQSVVFFGILEVECLVVGMRQFVQCKGLSDGVALLCRENRRRFFQEPGSLVSLGGADLAAGEPHEVGCHLAVLGAERLRVDGQRPLVGPFGARPVAGREPRVAEVRMRHGHRGMRGPEGLRLDRHHAFPDRGSSDVVDGFVEQVGLDFERPGDRRMIGARRRHAGIDHAVDKPRSLVPGPHLHPHRRQRFERLQRDRVSGPEARLPGRDGFRLPLRGIGQIATAAERLGKQGERVGQPGL